MKIKFIDLEGKTFFTNAVPFENIILKDSISLSDKTWKRYRHWAEDFTYSISDNIITQKLNPEINEMGYYEFQGYWWNPETEPLMSEKYYLFGHLIREKIYVRDTGRIETKSAIFEIIADNGEVIYKYNNNYDLDDYDWKVIAELSGQKDRRLARISIAQKHGHMMPIVMSELGIYIPNEKQKEKLLPLLESDFEKSDRGGYIVRGFGKFAISQINKTGYYKVTKELEKVKFISLVEEFKIVEE